MVCLNWRIHPLATWQTRSGSELAAVMRESKPALLKHASFKGFSVFTQGNWRMNTGTTQISWPAHTGAWYVDHKLVLNETQRTAWFTWAKARSIDAVFIAPHAGSTALISIPGAEGFAADGAKFCDLLPAAHSRPGEVSGRDQGPSWRLVRPAAADHRGSCCSLAAGCWG